MASSKVRTYVNQPAPAGLMGVAQSYGAISRGQHPNKGFENGRHEGGVNGALANSFGACDVAYDEGTVETFDCYEVASPIIETLEAHQGWSVAWVVADERIAIIEDTFETYTAENPVTSSLNDLTGGFDAGAWVIVNQV